MTIAICMIVFFLLLIDLDLSSVGTSLDRIANHLKAIEALERSTERIENRLYAIEKQMGKEVNDANSN